jgi:hypothetical protein
VKSLRQVVITKRDGTVERFSLSKLTNGLAACLRELNYDPALASPLARAVAMHLQEWSEPSPPSTSYIYRCVRAVLQQTGLSDVADALAAHRRRRQSQRQAIRVVDPEQPGCPGQAWRKSVLVATLHHDYGLRHAVCRFMAGQIESRVFALGYRVVSRPFLRELVRNEVLAWGLADEQAPYVKSAPVGPPAHLEQSDKET